MREEVFSFLFAIASSTADVSKFIVSPFPYRIELSGVTTYVLFRIQAPSKDPFHPFPLGDSSASSPKAQKETL